MVRRLRGAIGDSDDATPTHFTVVQMYQKSSKNPLVTYVQTVLLERVLQFGEGFQICNFLALSGMHRLQSDLKKPINLSHLSTS